MYEKITIEQDNLVLKTVRQLTSQLMIDLTTHVH